MMTKAMMTKEHISYCMELFNVASFKEKPYDIIIHSFQTHDTYMDLHAYTVNEYGQKHSYNDQPGSISVRGDQVHQKMWFKNDKIHRDNDRPAVIEYWLNGYTPVDDTLNSISWYQDDYIHRENKPAIYEYDNTGKIQYIGWFRFSQWHRVDGPGATIFNDGAVCYKWAYNGRVYKFNEWCKKVQISDSKKVELKLSYE